MLTALLKVSGNVFTHCWLSCVLYPQEWFVVSKKASKNFEKLLKSKPRPIVLDPTPEQNPGLRFTPGLSAWQEMTPQVATPSTVIIANPGAADAAEGRRKEPSGKDGEKERERSAQEHGVREKDCYDFDGSNSSSSSGGTSSSESEAEDTSAQTAHHDAWALKRPPITEPHHAIHPPPPAKQIRGNP